MSVKLKLTKKGFLIVFFVVPIVGALTHLYLFKEYNKFEVHSKYKLYDIGRAIFLFKEGEGRFPSDQDGLAELNEENKYTRYSIYNDLWGSEIIYEETPSLDNPFRLYSIGENQVDEMGAGDDIDFWSVKNELDGKMQKE